jgi:hypothetical protein
VDQARQERQSSVQGSNQPCTCRSATGQDSVGRLLAGGRRLAAFSPCKQFFGGLHIMR